ncbi:MAG: hypothetical protein GX434_17260 [Peptococcaceae bacterium]|nr:hypothetical protein [Peptococcaceae bacterium]
MACPDENKLQAYLDGELKRDERKALTLHLQNCSFCRSSLQELKELEGWVDHALTEAFPIPAEGNFGEEHEVYSAWNKFSGNILNMNNSPTLTDSRTSGHDPLPPVERSWPFVKRFRKYITGIAAAVIFASFFMIPQVQAAASDFLSLFRVSKIEMVKFTPQDIQQIERFFHSSNKGEISIQNFGKITIDEGSFKEQNFPTADDAIKTGITLPKVPQQYQMGSVLLRPSATVTMEFDTVKANQLMKELGSSAAFDSSLNGKKFTVVWPKSTSVVLKNPGQGFDNMIYSLSDSPKIQAPSLVDAENLRATLLQAPFIPEGVRSQLAKINDWQNTLPLPYFEGMGNTEVTEKITVNGRDGLFIQCKNQTSLLLWENQGQIYSLQVAYQKDSDNNTIKSSLLRLANQF